MHLLASIVETFWKRHTEKHVGKIDQGEIGNEKLYEKAEIWNKFQKLIIRKTFSFSFFFFF